MVKYPLEILDEDEDDGTMPDSRDALAEVVIGHRIVSVDKIQWGRYSYESGIVITLDNGTRVELQETGDCCAYTQIESFLLNPEAVDHIITGVGTTDGFRTWHIYADWGDVLKLDVGWSCGNPFYYGYGFNIAVKSWEDK